MTLLPARQAIVVLNTSFPFPPYHRALIRRACLPQVHKANLNGSTSFMKGVRPWWNDFKDRAAFTAFSCQCVISSILR